MLKGFLLSNGLLEDESNDMSQIQTDIWTYIDRRISEWIMNGNVDQEWDAYLIEIDKTGISKWISTKQAAYDRWSCA